MIIILLIIILLIIIFYFINILIKPTIEKFINNDNPPFPIDIVYTWKGEIKSNNIRNSYNYELKYSLRSLDAYAPWINKIYILVDPPKKYPSWIKKNNKIIMVDTSETFPSIKYLPNSNSNAIETTIVNIKGLSEHYIYLCDDIFLGRKTSYTDFFTNDGKALVDDKCIINHSILKDNNNILNIKYPPTVNKFYPHIPIPQIKSIVKEFYQEYPVFIEWIRKTYYRHDDGCDVCNLYNLNCPCQQIHYPICKYMFLKNKAILINNSDLNNVIFIMNNKMYNNNKCLLDNIISSKPLFYCINDDETNPIKRKKIRKDMLIFFNSYYPNKPSFEI